MLALRAMVELGYNRVSTYTQQQHRDTERQVRQAHNTAYHTLPMTHSPLSSLCAYLDL